MTDHIYTSFLETMREQAETLDAGSDLIDVVAQRGRPPQQYIVRMGCRGLVRVDETVQEHDRWTIGIQFPPKYLRGVSVVEVVNILDPLHGWHPNTGYGTPFMCLGDIRPGTDFITLVYQVWEILAWHIWDAADALNHEASRWARRQPPDRFPIERRPLMWKKPVGEGT